MSLVLLPSLSFKDNFCKRTCFSGSFVYSAFSSWKKEAITAMLWFTHPSICFFNSSVNSLFPICAISVYNLTYGTKSSLDKDFSISLISLSCNSLFSWTPDTMLAKVDLKASFNILSCSIWERRARACFFLSSFANLSINSFASRKMASESAFLTSSCFKKYRSVLPALILSKLLSNSVRDTKCIAQISPRPGFSFCTAKRFCIKPSSPKFSNNCLKVSCSCFIISTSSFVAIYT
ncbi:hypothetical protein ES707_07200 [subsurface metagenome]